MSCVFTWPALSGVGVLVSSSSSVVRHIGFGPALVPGHAEVPVVRTVTRKFERTRFFFLNLNFIFLLYNTVLVLPYIDMSPPQVYMSSQP